MNFTLLLSSGVNDSATVAKLAQNLRYYPAIWRKRISYILLSGQES